jgi:Rieske 2Fe-2S family protein
MSGHLTHPLSPRMDTCPPALPKHAYYDADWFAREMGNIWARNWVWAGRLNDLPRGTMQRRQVGAAQVIVCRDDAGRVTAFHNVCSHRGAELCSADHAPMGKLITCKYHAWAFGAADGRLVATGAAKPTADFDPSRHGLAPICVHVWAGFVFLNLDPAPRDFVPDMGRNALDNWPMDSLVMGHRAVIEVQGNWKLLWENYNECLHCAAAHPELSDLVPIYKQGIMAPNEALGWTPDAPTPAPLRAGAFSWTASGRACGPAFSSLTEAQRRAGFFFVTAYPSVFVVAHCDYVRAVAFHPVSPERTRVTAEWYFAQDTLDQPGFDASAVASFAKTVLAQDAEIVELNQRGLHSPGFARGRLMPEEYAVYEFQKWVLEELECCA